MSDASNVSAADDIAADGEVALAPVTVQERISSLDFIRGIAVMGILAANIIAFGQPLMATFDPAAFLSSDNDPDHWWWIAQFVLIDGKMRGLFSILFGAGFFLFLEKANERGSGNALVIRRLAFLGMFGLLHFYFIWFGDILFLYAVSALVLLAFYTLKPFNQFVLGMIGFVISALIYTAMMGGLYLMANGNLLSPEEAAEMQREMASGMSFAQGMTDAILAGDYLGFVAANFTENLLTPISALSQSLVETSSLMLIGMGLFRMGFFEGKFDRKKMVLWGWAGIIVGGALSYWVATWVISTDFDLLAAMTAYLGTSALPRLAMALGLAALLVVYSPSWTGWLGQRVSAAGRAAFTNYLGTSIVMLFVFHGWALGYYGDLGRPQLHIIVAIMWAVMLLWSKPWLDRFKYGPLEWLWRCLTYGKRFPLKR